jgi:hypothetical protein
VVYSEVIQESVAPAFLLGAVASFVSVLNLKYNRIIDQLNALDEADCEETWLDRRRLFIRRAGFVRTATLLATFSAATAAVLIVASFAYALFDISEQRGLPALFTLSLVFLGFSFIYFGREVFASHSDFKD